MYLIIGIIIGTMYGRNAGEINRKTVEDIRKVAWIFSKTQFAATSYYIIEAMYLAFERRFVHKNICTHDILCECNRRTCKPVSINTFVRKIKAIN